MSKEKLPPPQPVYVLRGHASQIHAVEFSPSNHRILTADADGWAVSWSLTYKRPVAAWRAHSEAVLGVAWWSDEVVITHGRDSKLIAWDLRPSPSSALSTTLPVSSSPATGSPPPTPSILHSLTVNTLNFCSFAHCFLPPPSLSLPSLTPTTLPPLLLAVPHTLSSEALDIHHFPSTHRRATIPAPPQTPPTGLTMALTFPRLNFLVAGYESGSVLAYAKRGDEVSSSPLAQPVTPAASADGAEGAGSEDSQQASATNDPDHARPYPGESWHCVYRARPHAQPVLSLAAHPRCEFFVSTAADAVLAKHVIPPSSAGVATRESQASKVVKTGHAGQQGARVRHDDGRIFATAGWDGRVRVYAASSLREVAVLKWHVEGCYAVGFARVAGGGGGGGDRQSGTKEWDAAQGSGGDVQRRSAHTATEDDDVDECLAGEEVDDATGTLAVRESRTALASETVALQRERKAHSTHWLAAGSKDGKVSLWDIY